MYVRSWVRFPSGTQIFSLSHARDKLNIPPFSDLTFNVQMKIASIKIPLQQVVAKGFLWMLFSLSCCFATFCATIFVKRVRMIIQVLKKGGGKGVAFRFCSRISDN